ncbi:lipopolysaccharide biosynthesis protein [Caulobacter sp. 1776]|uniref:lipopolysaccharide biosynthesis protein n=1 Tax=Caulobacter sp. 1776 TaxID=3156420 RepID=UPI003396476A
MLNLFYVTAITGLTVPVLIHAWGVPEYGTWLMLTAIPTYLSLSDFGFATAATNEIAMSTARGDLVRATSTLHSVWALNLVACAIIVLASSVAGAIMYAINFHREFAAVVPLLASFSAACLLSRVVLGAFRGGGRYATGTLLYDGLQFCEGLVSLLAAVFGLKFLGVAITLLAARAGSTLISYFVLRKTIPHLSLGVSKASIAQLKELLAPAFASMSIPIALALNMQGVAVVLGAIVSPTATAALSTTRTVSRVAVQIISALNRALIPELSAASARGDHGARAKILRLNRLVLIAVALPAAIAFIAIGGPLVSLWTSGRIVPPFPTVAALGVAMALHCIWFFGTNMLSATNAHGRMAVGLLFASILTVGLAYVGGHAYGINGVAVSIAIGELCNVAIFYVIQRRLKPNLG